MAFYGSDFIFDGIPSEEYGLTISSPDGESSTNASGHVDLITEEVYRRHTPYFYGVKTANVLKFPISIRTTETEITAEDAAFMQRWLFGQLNYKELRIVQPDMEGVYFKCFLVDPAIYRVGNIIRGFEADVLCDSPFAYGEEQTNTLLENNNSLLIHSLSTPIYIENKSDDNYYTYPILTIEMRDNIAYASYPENEDDWELMRSVKLLNESDNNRVFYIGEGYTASEGEEYLNNNEYIIINNDLQTISSYTSSSIPLTPNNKIRIQLLRDGLFFRLVPGINKIYAYGDAKNISISYSPLRRIS